jgi:hypothetical protein
MRFLNFKNSFQNLETEYFLRTNLEVSCLTDLRQTRGAKKIPKTGLKTNLKTKEPTYMLWFSKNTLLYISEANQLKISVFRRFTEDYLRNLMC